MDEKLIQTINDIMDSKRKKNNIQVELNIVISEELKDLITIDVINNDNRCTLHIKSKENP